MGESDVQGRVEEYSERESWEGSSGGVCVMRWVVVQGRNNKI